MRINEANIFLFIATIIIGILISMNISLDGSTKFLDVEQYESAYNDRLKLQGEISDLQDKYYEVESKIIKYENSSRSEVEVLTEMQEELEKNKILLGIESVKGDGVKITLNDAEEVTAGGEYTTSMLVHDKDILRVINDLRNAGAEAISVNGHRISISSSILCVGSTVSLDGIKMSAPFSIVALGNEEGLKTYLENQQNHVKVLKGRKCVVQVETVYDVKMSGYTGSMSTEFLKSKTK